ncbi:MAG: class I SAM-dependent methyltransferase [Cyclobacteriaceae bacterium]
MDIYYVRMSILKAIDSSKHYFSARLLDAGCGAMPYRQYILENTKVTDYTGLDIESALVYDNEVVPDFTWDGNVMPFEDSSFDTVIATEVLEHCPVPSQFLIEVQRVLAHRGYLFITVPFLWNLHEVPHDEYRYTPFSLKRLLEEAGLEVIQITGLGGWHASMAQMLGLWVRRAPLPFIKFSRGPLSYFILPIYKLLLYLDKRQKLHNSEGQIHTGYYCVAKKPHE